MADTSGYGVANPYFEKAAEAALPSQAAYDTAAARIRSRLEGKQAADARQIQDTYAGRGLSQSGLQEGAQRQNREKYMGEYATGLADLEKEYNDSRQEGARILQGIGGDAGRIKTQQDQVAGNLLGNYSGIYGFLEDKDPRVGDFIRGITGTPIDLPSAAEFARFAAGGASPDGGTDDGGGTTPIDTGALPTDPDWVPPSGAGASAAPNSNTTPAIGTPEYESHIERGIATYRGLGKALMDQIVQYYGYVPSWLLALKTKYNIPDRYWGRN